MPSTKIGLGLVLRRLLTSVFIYLWTVRLSWATFLALMGDVMIVRGDGSSEEEE